ncbi:hypothetical protein BJ508DRAFT_303536 [Ascobolus immersus RN42]|uniref:Uncharacterized protein n=1 Tax=Ascobolus immersus RN42 TaxID=1160509 RepID=A0A3N4IT37_ASCIM|nr:hypothetical protein BJ508DRAFT_303536 [Ascobolus immersus RN42]
MTNLAGKAKDKIIPAISITMSTLSLSPTSLEYSTSPPSSPNNLIPSTTTTTVHHPHDHPLWSYRRRGVKTPGWLSEKVENTSDFLVGMVVFLLMRGVMTPPAVSIPRDNVYVRVWGVWVMLWYGYALLDLVNGVRIELKAT